MIAIVAGDEQLRRGPVPIALAHAGFEPCETCSADAAASHVGVHGAQECVLVVDADSLASDAGGATWGDFLKRHQRVPAVVVARREPDREAAEVVGAPHRILLECPFDAAAVVAAAVRASSTARHRVHRVSSGESPGSKYAS